MSNTVSRVLIEAFVRETMKNFRDSPERSMRKLVDMALNFADGPVQQRFFENVRTVLKNEHSVYYKLIPDVVAATDSERLLQFGMNLGFNSCILGAKTIQSIEKAEHFRIPWSVSLCLSGNDYAADPTLYDSIIEQGSKLGIFTWMVHSRGNALELLRLAAAHPECAIVLYCPTNEITNAFLDEAVHIYNLMVAVKATHGIEDACEKLRERRFLYSVYTCYGESDLHQIVDGSFLEEAASMHPVFTAFLPAPDCSQRTRDAVYQYVKKVRNEQLYPTIPWDVIHDPCVIDRTLSGEQCFAAFDGRGILHTLLDSSSSESLNAFQSSLRDIFQAAFPEKQIKLPTF